MGELNAYLISGSAASRYVEITFRASETRDMREEPKFVNSPKPIPKSKNHNHSNQPVVPADSAAKLSLLQSLSSTSALRPLSLCALSLSLSFLPITQCHESPLTLHTAPPPLPRSTFTEATSSARELHHSLLLAHSSAPQPAEPSMSNPCGSSHVQVEPGFQYLVRLHFRDLVSQGLNELYFNVYVDSLFAAKDLDLSTLSQNALGVPYYRDMVTALASSNSL
ncbi:hypothetical protein PIB30_092085 [Stylosanthes scabra]|uniref:Uncharacterized protein n=1 Tax=Stylosanthes scabra TaxID=79078 RepID=A0ABU6WUE0_9FABA|nr:hypothetical protein [Stylosanthes scabra]